jgi:1,4-dihydroxy-2-naphthoyl-CoA hydrolase
VQSGNSISKLSYAARLDLKELFMSIWHKAFSLDQATLFRRNTLIETLGIELLERGDDFLRGRMPVDQRTIQPAGILHGGASVALAETLGSIAGEMATPEGKTVVGLEINANHIKAMRSGFVIGTARAEHLGRSTQVWVIRIENETGELVCLSRFTTAVIDVRG